MKPRIATGIDIGTRHVKMVIVEEVHHKNEHALNVIGTGSALMHGMHQGYVVNKEEVVASIQSARRAAESAARVHIRSGFLSIGCVSIEETHATGETIISRADQEITALDLETTLKKAREKVLPLLLNRTVLHEIPLTYRVDETCVYGHPIGMRGAKLEVDYLFITSLTQHSDKLVSVAEDANIEIIDQMASPLAGSNVILTNEQKMRGCILADIGAETVSTVIYDEGIPLSVKIFPLGSDQITDDLAVAFKISLEDAERIKLGRLGGVMYPRKKIDTVISTRISRIMQDIEKHLKTIGQRRPLPAGIIFSGGGGDASVVTETAKRVLSLPAHIGEIAIIGPGTPKTTKFRENAWAVAYGTALWGLTGEIEHSRATDLLKIKNIVSKFFHQFLP